MTKRKRAICNRCSRPKPQACICAALPDETKLITLSKCRVLVLQHPNEAKRKNRSLPLIELCMSPSPSPPSIPESEKEEYNNHNDKIDGVKTGSANTTNNTIHTGDMKSENYDFNFEVIVTKRLGEQVAQTHPHIMKLLHDPSNPVFLCYPSDDAVSVNEALGRVRSGCPHEHEDEVPSPPDGKNHHNTAAAAATTTTTTINTMCTKHTAHSSEYHSAKITLVFLDATWKYAKEMDAKSIQHNSWPRHMIRIKLNPEAGDCDFDRGEDQYGDGDEKRQGNSNSNSTFKPRRFDIRTPPSANHLSTAECIAHVLRIVEGDYEGQKMVSSLPSSTNGNTLFDVLMRPLDLMVKQWHSFSDKKKKSALECKGAS